MDLDPADDELAAQLLAIRWSIDSAGRTVIESKDDMRKRGVPSPDRADAVAMSIDMPAPYFSFTKPTPAMHRRARELRELERVFDGPLSTEDVMEIEW